MIRVTRVIRVLRVSRVREWADTCTCACSEKYTVRRHPVQHALRVQPQLERRRSRLEPRGRRAVDPIGEPVRVGVRVRVKGEGEGEVSTQLASRLSRHSSRRAVATGSITSDRRAIDS